MAKKILYIIEAELKSGAGKCAIEYAHLLKADGAYQPIIVTQHANDINDWCQNEDIENYSVHYARTCSLGMGILGKLIAFICRPFLNFLAFRNLKKYIDFSQLAIIHSNAVSIDFGAYLYRKTGLPHVWHIRDFMLFYDNWNWHPIISNLPKYIDANSTKIITVSKELRNYLINNGCSSNKIAAIYDGIPLPPERISKSSCKNKEKLNVVCIGHFCKLKGQDSLIKAIAAIPQQLRKNFQFDFYGKSNVDYLREIKNLIHHLQIEDCISIKPFSKNIYDVLKKYDIGVQPSHSEGFSRVTAEYMIAGLGVIAAKEGAIPELIEHEVSGLLYEDYNFSELANSLTYFYSHQDELHKMAVSAQKKALKEFVIEYNFNKIVNEYNQLCKK